ncbi:MAG: RHS repeat-associated core domain-containing protein [Anaerolineales bacterium]
MRANGDLKFLMGDHLGSTSLVTDANGQNIIETRYTAWGEVRYSTPNSTLPTKYTFTGQYSYQSDFGLMFFNARWVDVSLGRFAQADTIIPGGVQGYDRYAYVNNSPVMFADPSGHCIVENDSDTCGIYEHSKDILDSAVVLLFAKPGSSQYDTFGALLTGEEANLVSSQGLGVAVNGTQIKTADHVAYGYEGATHLWVFVGHAYYIYNIDEIKIEHGPEPGDVATITLPGGLPPNVTQAQLADDYHAAVGQTLVTTYVVPTKNRVGQVFGFTLHSAETVTQNPVIDRAKGYGYQIKMVNPNNLLNSGDFGGPVFYNDQLIGVNSGKVAVAPLCFIWTFKRIVGGSTYAIPC